LLAASLQSGLAYERYNDGCHFCHGDFTGGISPKGTTFPGGDKHEMHRSSSYMNTECDLCHTSGDGRDPFIGSSDGTNSNPGLGCTGCHQEFGLRAHHETAGSGGCLGCHGNDSAPPPESQDPTYYGTIDTNVANACNPTASPNLNENWSVGDFEGLDNDGDGLYDGADPDCQDPVPVYDLEVLAGLAVAGGAGNAALVRDPLDGKNMVYVRNASDGGAVKNIEFLDSTWTAFDLAASDDANSNSSPDLAVGAVEAGTGAIAVQVRDGLSGAFIKNLFFLTSDWTPIQVLAIPSNDQQNAGPEIGVLAVNDITGEIVVSVKDAASNAFIGNVFFLNANWDPISAIVIPGFDANTGDEIGVLAVNRSTGQIVVMVKDMLSNTFIKNAFYLNSNWTPVSSVFVPNAAHAGPVVAVLASNNGTGQIVTMLKDVSDNTFVRNLFHLGSSWTPQFLDVVPAITTADDEVAVLGVNASDKPVVQNKDAGTNTFVSNVSPLGSSWTILAMDAFQAGSSAAPSVSILGQRTSDGILVIQTFEAGTGAQVSSVFVP
jgi:hypothetical protein